MASTRLACLLVLAIKSGAEEGATTNFPGASGAHPRMTAENRLWGQKRIQAELARLGFRVSARTVAKYMRWRRDRGPSPGWREFLKRHESNIWACDFFCVQTIWFQTLYVFFVVRHVNREILHVAVTPCPTAEWTAQQIVECCAWDRWPPRLATGHPPPAG
jgi:hypothetical protein